MNRKQRAARLKQARIRAGFPLASAAADAFNWNRNTYASNENGNAPYSFKKAAEYAAAFGVTAIWLYAGESAESAGPVVATTPLIGEVGRLPDGVVDCTEIAKAGIRAPAPPAATPNTVAIRVRGGAYGDLARDGLIYFDDERRRPTPAMTGELAVVETKEGEVLVARLMTAEQKKRYDLELDGKVVRTQCALKWAAEIRAVIPGSEAKRLLDSNAAN